MEKSNHQRTTRISINTDYIIFGVCVNNIPLGVSGYTISSTLYEWNNHGILS